MVSDSDTLRSLGPEWDRVAARSVSRSFFASWHWVETWWRHYQEPYDLLTLVARRGSEPIAIAPLVVRRGPSPRLEYMAQDRAYGEYLEVLGDPDDVEHAIPVLAGHLANLRSTGVWSSAHLATMLSTSPTLPLLEQALVQNGVAVLRTGERACPYVELPGTWPEYLRAKGPDLARRVRYNRSRLERSGPVQLEWPRDAGQVAEFFDEFVRLSHLRWRTPVHPRFVSFLQDLVLCLFPRGELVLCRLRVGDTVVAAKLDFVFDGKIWGYQGGWLPDWGTREVGSVLLCELFQWGIETGMREYDFLEGDVWYKRRWSTAVRLACDLVEGPDAPGYVFDPFPSQD